MACMTIFILRFILRIKEIKLFMFRIKLRIKVWSALQ